MDEKEAGPSDLHWIERREKVVLQAITDGDLGKLRELAALPGGFGSNAMRQRVWPILLGTNRYFGSHDNTSIVAGDENRGDQDKLAAHPEEEQVGKDTNRSFVNYPRGIPPEEKSRMKADLHRLIVGVLRRWPSLSYFQGFHDIISVLYLTYIPLPETRPRSSARGDNQPQKEKTLVYEPGVDEKEIVPAENDEAHARTAFGKGTRDGEEWRTLRQCAEVLSLCRVRDAMGTGMQPLMGYLKILKRLLTVADPEIARFSSTISPVPTLPFFALSWILTLFSHDVDTLEPIQRMFDFLLSRNPIAAIYLAVAILVAKKPQMLKLVRNLGSEAEDDPSILHPLFARLPPLFADDPDTASPLVDGGRQSLGGMDEEKNPYNPIALTTIFKITDDLLARYPWDGPIIRGSEIMGEASSVNTYTREAADDWDLEQAESLVNGEVIKPGADMLDEDHEEDTPSSAPRLPRRLRLPRNKLGTMVAVSVVLVGIGIAIYGTRSGGPRSNWTRLWSVVLRDWTSRSHPAMVQIRTAVQHWTAASSSMLHRLLE